MPGSAVLRGLSGDSKLHTTNSYFRVSVGIIKTMDMEYSICDRMAHGDYIFSSRRNVFTLRPTSTYLEIIIHCLRFYTLLNLKSHKFEHTIKTHRIVGIDLTTKLIPCSKLNSK